MAGRLGGNHKVTRHDSARFYWHSGGGDEFLIHATHEEYWFRDYFAYQPDSKAKLLAAAKAVHDAGYEYCFIEDKIDWQ